MLDFGSHASFIWTSYGITFVVLLGLVLYAIKRNRHD